MAKLKLGSNPKSFKRTVTVDMLDGTKGAIECTFRYRTRSEFGKFLDSVFDDAGGKATGADDTMLADTMTRTRDTNADYLLQILDGWNLDEELNRGNLQLLCDEFPGMANAIMSVYRDAVTEGRLKN